MMTTPPIQPVSYPKKTPPKAAKAQIRYALNVTGASILDKSAVPWMGTKPTAPIPILRLYEGLVGFYREAE
jgi:hypothetical protein